MSKRRKINPFDLEVNIESEDKETITIKAVAKSNQPDKSNTLVDLNAFSKDTIDKFEKHGSIVDSIFLDNKSEQIKSEHVLGKPTKVEVKNNQIIMHGILFKDRDIVSELLNKHQLEGHIFGYINKQSLPDKQGITTIQDFSWSGVCVSLKK